MKILAKFNRPIGRAVFFWGSVRLWFPMFVTVLSLSNNSRFLPFYWGLLIGFFVLLISSINVRGRLIDVGLSRLWTLLYMVVTAIVWSLCLRFAPGFFAGLAAATATVLVQLPLVFLNTNRFSSDRTGQPAVAVAD